MRENRRNFLKKSVAALVSVPCLVPSTVVGQSRLKPSDKITLGFIGVGGMGTGNLRNALSRDTTRILAICDVDDRHAERARNLVNEKYGNSDCTTGRDFLELIGRDDIDAICSSLPDQSHALVAVAAARAGKDIYGEKPLGYTIEEGRAIVDAVQRYGRIWQTGSWQRSQRHFRFACELVRNGKIGKVHTVYVGLPQGNSGRNTSTVITEPPTWFDYDRWLGPAPYVPYCEARCHWNFRWNLDYSGGQLTDWAGHHCDIAQWAMGTELTSPIKITEPSATFPQGDHPVFDTPTDYRFVCHYREGFKMIVSDAKQMPKGMGAYFVGDEGWVHVDRGGKLRTEPKSLANYELGPNDIHLYESNDHWGNFLDCVKSRKATITPAEVAHRSIMVGHLGLIAIKLNRDLQWDPEQERFSNDPEADRLLARPMRSPRHL